MSHVAFIGLGNMGSGMAANLVKKGRTVRAFDLSSAALDKAASDGAQKAPSAADAVKGAEAIVTTEKDAVRFPMIERRDLPIYFLRVEIEMLSGAEDFHDCIARICFK